MTDITLSNTTRTVILDQVAEYLIGKSTTHPVKKIPAKQDPTIDEGAKTTTPRSYRIGAKVDVATRDALLSLESDREMITLSNGSITDVNCFLDKGPECEFLVGREISGEGASRPWICRVTLISSAN